MQVIARRTLREFWARHPRAEGRPCLVRRCRQGALGQSGRDKRQFGGTVDFVGDNRVIFDLAATNIG